MRIVQQTLENLSKFECNVGNQMAIESNEAIWKLLLWIKNLKGSIENSMLKELKQLLQKSYKSKVPTQMLQIVITELGLLFYKSHYLRISKILHLLKLNDFRENQLLINPRNRIEYLEISFIVLMLFSSREILASKKCHIVVCIIKRFEFKKS